MHGCPAGQPHRSLASGFHLTCHSADDVRFTHCFINLKVENRNAEHRRDDRRAENGPNYNINNNSNNNNKSVSCQDDCRVLRCTSPDSKRSSVAASVIQTLVVSLVLSRLDYGNASLTDIPTCFLYTPSAVHADVLNAAARPARVISGLPCLAHICTTLANLDVLRAVECIKLN